MLTSTRQAGEDGWYRWEGESYRHLNEIDPYKHSTRINKNIYISKKYFWIPGCHMDSGILLDSRGFWPCDFSNPGFWTQVSAAGILDMSFCCSGILKPLFCCWQIPVPPFLFKLTPCVKRQTFIHVPSVILAMTSVLSQYR